MAQLKDTIINGNLEVTGKIPSLSVDTISIGGGPVIDYIIEYGEETSSSWNWHWEKWASGKVYVYCTITTIYQAETQYATNIYYHTYNVTIPDDVPLISGTIERVNIARQYATSGLAYFSTVSIEGKKITYVIVDYYTAAFERTVSYSFYGRWK